MIFYGFYDRSGEMKCMAVNDSIIPSYWDKSCLEDIPMEKGLNPNDENTMNKFGKIELTGKDLEAIQYLGSSRPQTSSHSG